MNNLELIAKLGLRLSFQLNPLYYPQCLQYYHTKMVGFYSESNLCLSLLKISHFDKNELDDFVD